MEHTICKEQLSKIKNDDVMSNIKGSIQTKERGVQGVYVHTEQEAQKILPLGYQ